MVNTAEHEQAVPNLLHDWLTETGLPDLHVVAGYPPVMRIHGALRPLE